jgi:head-tail adaptor
MFPDRATIERVTVSQDDEGGPDESWATLLSDVPAQFSAFFSASAGESEVPGTAAVAREARCILLGDHDIGEADRLVLLGKSYDVMGVERDSFAIVTTLRVVERSP